MLRDQQSKVIDTSKVHRVTVRRSNIFMDAMTILQKGFDKASCIRITFLVEPGVDAGGPSREFFRLLVWDIVCNNSLFQGEEANRSPIHNIMELRKGTFKLIGEAFALSIIHGGPGPQCLSHPVVDYLSYGLHKINGTIEDIPDSNIRQKVKQVSPK